MKKHARYRSLASKSAIAFMFIILVQSASADAFRVAINLGGSPPPPPPPVIVEHPWVAPAPQAVWIPGHWTLNEANGQWVWYPGYYEYPPVPWAVYEPAHHYEHHHDHYWVHGHWRY